VTTDFKSSSCQMPLLLPVVRQKLTFTIQSMQVTYIAKEVLSHSRKEELRIVFANSKY